MCKMRSVLAGPANHAPARSQGRHTGKMRRAVTGTGRPAQSPCGPISSDSRACEREAIATEPSSHISFCSFLRIRIRRSAPVTNLFAASLESTPPSIASAHFMVTTPQECVIDSGGRATSIPMTDFALDVFTRMKMACLLPRCSSVAPCGNKRMLPLEAM